MPAGITDLSANNSQGVPTIIAADEFRELEMAIAHLYARISMEISTARLVGGREYKDPHVPVEAGDEDPLQTINMRIRRTRMQAQMCMRMFGHVDEYLAMNLDRSHHPSLIGPITKEEDEMFFHMTHQTTTDQGPSNGW